MKYSDLVNKMLKLTSTRVWRTYSGGMELEKWQGVLKPSDSEFPEEWIGSTVKARNPGRENIPDEGLSKVVLENGEEVNLKEVLESNPKGFLGKTHYKKFGTDMGMLVKIIDSLVRLTIQVHPDKLFAKDVFNSIYGKTEAWYILGGRELNGEAPYVLLGFKQGLTRGKWEELFFHQNTQGMQEALNKIYVKPGEVYFIEGGVPHAIGPGCFLVEIQEPTDYTLRVERKIPEGKTIPDILCHQGAGFEKLFDCFHYDTYSEQEVKNKWRVEPKVVDSNKDFCESILVGKDQTSLFEMCRLTVNSSYKSAGKDAFSIIIVLSGRGKIVNEHIELNIKQGDSLFIPEAVSYIKIEADNGNRLELVCCNPPSV